MEVRSKKKKFNPGKYGLPGGHVVKDSSPIDTAIEEVAEEIGYKLDKDDLIFLNVVEPAHPYRSFSHQHLHFADLDINDLVYQESEVEALE
ncbi:hypothetical protein FACS189459_1480 [Bacilli bacterium]|nr:hypothetical protein FACS189459_1480 [Bacilli bacterium]